MMAERKRLERAGVIGSKQVERSAFSYAQCQNLDNLSSIRRYKWLAVVNFPSPRVLNIINGVGESQIGFTFFGPAI
jgi:hypothetical protein